MNADLRVLVAIPTRGERPLGSLLRAMESISDDRVDYRFFIDRHCDPEAVGRVAVRSTDRAVATQVTGYASMRNYMIDYAVRERYAYIIFFDDDQAPLLGWVQAMLEDLGDVERRPAVVFGPVVAIGLGRAAAPVEDLRAPELLSRPHGLYEGDVYSGNTGLNLKFVVENSLRFDPKYDKAGGEDTAFFRNLRLRGGVVVFNPEAVACEFIPDVRRSVKARFRAGGVAHRRKDAIGRSRGRALLSASAAFLRSLKFASLAVISYDRQRMAQAAFWAGVFARFMRKM